MFGVGTLFARIKVDTSDLSRAERQTTAATRNMGGGFTKLAAAVGAYVSVTQAFQALRIAESMTLIDQRIKNATKSTSEFTAAQKKLIKTSNDTGAALENVVATFENLKLVAEDIGVTNDQSLRLVDILNKIGVIGSTSLANLNSAITQFGQSMAKGVLNGDELGSILENMPRLAIAIAKSMKVGVGELKQMGAEGKLIMSEILPGLLKQQDEINKKFETMPKTMARAFNELTNSFGQLLKGINDEFKITEGIAERISALAQLTATMEESFFGGRSKEAQEYADVVEKLFQVNEKLKESLNDPSAGLQNTNRTFELTKQVLALEERRHELQKKFIADKKAAGVEPVTAAGMENVLTPKTDALGKKLGSGKKGAEKSGGQKALDERAQKARDAAAAAKELRKKIAEEEQAEFDARNERGQAAFDQRAALAQRELALEESLAESKRAIGQAALDERARQFEQQEALQQTSQLMQLSAMEGFTGTFLQILKAGGKESSGVYKALFLAQKALAVAQIIISTKVASARTLAELGPIAGPPVAGSIEIAGYANAGLVAGMAVAETFSGSGRQNGGLIYPGATHEVGEGNQPEIFQQGAKKYLFGGNQGGMVKTLGQELGSTSSAPMINVTLIEDSKKAGTVQQSGSNNNQELKVFVESIVRSTVSNDIARGGNNISRSLQAAGLDRKGVING